MPSSLKNDLAKVVSLLIALNLELWVHIFLMFFVMKWEVLYMLSNSVADSNIMVVPQKSTGANYSELNWQSFNATLFSIEIMSSTWWFFRPRYLADIFSKWTYSIKGESIPSRQTNDIIVADDKIWALKRKLEFLENLYQPLWLMRLEIILTTNVIFLILCNKICQHLEVLDNSMNWLFSMTNAQFQKSCLIRRFIQNAGETNVFYVMSYKRLTDKASGSTLQLTIRHYHSSSLHVYQRKISTII